MTDTMMNMELRFADHLFPDQLMEGDIIKVDNEFVTVKSFIQNDEGFNMCVLNDFDETIDIFLWDDEKVELYVFIE
jgi:hypothetical protein